MGWKIAGFVGAVVAALAGYHGYYSDPSQVNGVAELIYYVLGTAGAGLFGAGVVKSKGPKS